MKLVTNLVLGLNRAALAEGLAFAEAIGLAPADALEVLLNCPAYSRTMDAKGPKMVAGDFAPQAKLSQHLKDVRIILDEADARRAAAAAVDAAPAAAGTGRGQRLGRTRQQRHHSGDRSSTIITPRRSS